MPTIISIGRGMRRALLFLFVLALPGPVRAQEVGPTPAPRRAGAAAAGFVKGGEIAGESRIFLGAWGALVLGDHFVLGGGGMAMTRDVELRASGLPTGFYLDAGYGGVLFKYWGDLPRGFSGEASILLGAGQAEVNDRITGQEVGAKNFLVLEPEVSLFLHVYRQVHLGASGGYRATSRIEDLPRVPFDALNSFTATLSLRVGGR